MIRVIEHLITQTHHNKDDLTRSPRKLRNITCEPSRKAGHPAAGS